MGAVILAGILGYEGQVFKEVREDGTTGKVTVVCSPEHRHRPVASQNGRAGPANCWLRRTVRDLPLGGRPCEVEIEYAKVFLSSCVHIETLPFVAPSTPAKRRFARLVSDFMLKGAIVRHIRLSWHSEKALAWPRWLEACCRRAGRCSAASVMGVDEVVRAKGQDYVSLVDDLTPGENCGRIQWVRAGPEAAILREFFNALSMQMFSKVISDCRRA